MTDFGVQPTGFVRKPLSVILTEIEALNRTEFGAGVVQTAESPLGQLNGIFAELAAKLWELGEDVYQSYDPDQAEGFRLETLGRLRLLDRAAQETDESYRQGITNTGIARIDIQDISRAVAALDGVTYSHVFINSDADVDENGQPGGSLCIAATGGDGAAIGQAIRSYIAPGVKVYGNATISSVIDGYCRTLKILRPIEISVDLTVRVRLKNDIHGCPPPSAAVIQAALLKNMYLLNGDDIDHYAIRSVIENLFSGVEVVSFNGQRDDVAQSDDMPVIINFLERAVLDSVVVLPVT